MDHYRSGGFIAYYYLTLDGNGNRTQVDKTEPLPMTLTDETVSYTYNTQRNRLLSANAVSFSYDNEGQLISKMVLHIPLTMNIG